jgi:peptidoglycan hydrolase-like protein with peptidoglycan-binding domain
MIRSILLAGFSIFILTTEKIMAQHIVLKPGFDKAEYIEMLKITGHQMDTPWTHVTTPMPEKTKFVYRSKVIGLDNKWDLWMMQDSIAVISIRGTTKSQKSWLENFYAAMVPASGSIQMSQNFTFNYQLADNPKASVHLGWLIGTAFLSQDILPKIDSLYKSGIKQMIILGHSQGGAIAYLMNSYLNQLQKTNQIPSDIRFKTYCSAAPRPGNLFYAYEYEKMVSDGWGYNIVNTADWVVQTPLSIQALTDFNTTNPFTNASAIINKQPFPKNWVLKYAYNRLNNVSKKGNRRYEKYLGKTAGKMVQKNLPGFVIPDYAKTFEYVRVGPTIVLTAKDDYFKKFPDNPEKIFVHHFINAYLYLADQL